MRQRGLRESCRCQGAHTAARPGRHRGREKITIHNKHVQDRPRIFIGRKKLSDTNQKAQRGKGAHATEPVLSIAVNETPFAALMWRAADPTNNQTRTDARTHLWRINSEGDESLRVKQRELDDFTQFYHGVPRPAHVVVAVRCAQREEEEEQGGRVGVWVRGTRCC